MCTHFDDIVPEVDVEVQVENIVPEKRELKRGFFTTVDPIEGSITIDNEEHGVVDFDGRSMRIGDRVAYAVVCGQSAALRVGNVTKVDVEKGSVTVFVDALSKRVTLKPNGKMVIVSR